MRRLFPYLAALGLLCAGALGWLLVRDRFLAHEGTVSGSVTAAPTWKEGTLVLGGTSGETLHRIGTDGTIGVVQEVSADRVATAARSRDGSRLFVTLRGAQDDASSELWLLAEGKKEFLFALRGHVTDASLSDDGGFASFLFTPTEGRTTEGAVFDLARKKYWTAAKDAAQLIWTGAPNGLLALDSAGKIWYHDRASFFTASQPALVGETTGGFAWRDDTADVVVTALGDEGSVELRSIVLTTTAIETVARLDVTRPPRSFALSPDAAHLILIGNDEQVESGAVSLFRFADATLERLPVAARRVQWVDSSAFLVEDAQAGTARLLSFSLATATATPFLGSTTLRLVP